MSLSIYKVEWQPLHYPGSLGESELDFLRDFSRDDGAYYIDEDMIEATVEAYSEQDREEQLPQELIEFLRAKLQEEGEAFSIALL